MVDFVDFVDFVDSVDSVDFFDVNDCNFIVLPFTHYVSHKGGGGSQFLIFSDKGGRGVC